jgi:phosphoserine phosphatase
MAGNPLPSWNDGTAKAAILDFLARVTRKGGPGFVPASRRIATFDNDGTLWCEQPVQVQVAFTQDRLAKLAAKDPALAARPSTRAFLERDMKAIHALGLKGVMEVAFATHSGMSPEAFDAIARAWLERARHPTFDRRWVDGTYRPQIELLDHLRANGFKTFIVSGGGDGFMRAFAEEAYGIPPEQVIGTCARTRVEIKDGRAGLVKLAELASFDDREEKVVNIDRHIGRRPILAFGNSDGDLAMLRHVRGGSPPGLALLLHHDDDGREVAYDRDFKLSPLAEALDRAEAYGITVVSMKRDWKTVFGGGP